MASTAGRAPVRRRVTILLAAGDAKVRARRNPNERVVAIDQSSDDRPDYDLELFGLGANSGPFRFDVR